MTLPEETDAIPAADAPSEEAAGEAPENTKDLLAEAEDADRAEPDSVADALRRFGGGSIQTRDMRTRDGKIVVGHRSFAAENVVINEASDAAGHRRIEARLISDWAASYQLAHVAGEADTQLDRELARRSVVVLSGQDGSGRTAAACVALARRHGSPDRVAWFDLTPQDQLADLTRDKDAFHPGAGHLVHLGDVRVPDALTLAALASHTRSLDATIVIVIDSDRTKTIDSSPFFGHVRHVRPPARTVFEAHLKHRLGDCGCLGDCAPCRGDCVTVYIRTCCETPGLMDSPGRLQILVEAAEEIALKRPRGEDLRMYGISRSSSEEKALISRVLAGGADDPAEAERARAFRIACVLFQGEPLNTVIDVAELLLRATAGTEEMTPLRPPPGGYEALLGAELTALWMPAGDRRTAESQRAAAGVARTLIDMLWAGALRPRDLLCWLRFLVTESADQQVRWTAAFLAGGCAEHDFTTVCEDLLKHWALARQWQVRECAALALVAVAAFSPQGQVSVREQVGRWAKSDSALLKDTVVRAYAAGLGQVVPYHGSIDLLWVAVQPAQRRSGLVAEAVSRLDLPMAELLTTLLSWIDGRSALPAVHAVRAFVLLAGRMSESGAAPDLLARAAEGEADGPDLVRLWQSALLHPASAFDAWRRLTDWVRIVPAEPVITGAFVRLMTDIAADPQVRVRLRHQVAHVWRGRIKDSLVLDDLSRIAEES